MPRVKRGVIARARHKKVLNAAKGYRGRRKNVYRIAKQAVMKAGQYAYRDRRQKKAAVEVDRKVLADLAVFDKAAFAKFAELAKNGLAA